MDSDTTGTAQPAQVQPVDLDAAIDAVARSMTDFEPSGALRARVLERIEQEQRRPSRAVPRWAWAGAAAAATLALATAVWVLSPIGTPGNTQSTVADQRSGAPALAATRAGRPATPPAAPPDAVSPAGESPSIPRTSRRAADGRARTAEADVPQDRHPVPALAEIEPLRFASVEPAPLQIADVEISPITGMTAIDIPSLDPGSRDIQSADSKKEK